MTETDKPIAWSPQQQAVFDFVTNGRGSAFITAVAGAGKTTTIVEACRRMEGSICFAAYNTKIAEEIKAKIAKLNLSNRIDVGTFHKFGFAAWRKVHPKVRLSGKNGNPKKEDVLADDLHIDEAVADFVFKLVSLAKQRALGLFGSVDDDSKWWDMVEHYDLGDELEDEKDMPRAVALAKKALAASRAMAHDLIDFDDMIYMPVVTGTRMWQNDWLLVDEAQDTNPARRALARKMLRLRGRSLWVGDPRQAIYGFTGADHNAVELIEKEFSCAQLPLTVTYRCPKLVVIEAQKLVGHIQAHESAPDGKVSRIDHTEMPVDLGPRDAILCRLNKPLITEAYRLIRAGIGCHVEGRDIGAGLLKLATKWKAARTLDGLGKKLHAYNDREVERFKAKGNDEKAQAVEDRVETLFTIMEGCKDIDGLTTKINELFQDTVNGHEDTLTLSSVHKSKGREWPRVFVLGHNEYMPCKWAKLPWQIEQEENLIYVAYTRAQSELVLVSVPPKKTQAPAVAA